MIKRLILLAAALWPVSSSAQVLNWGDYNDQNQTIYFYFNTINPDTKAPEALTGGAVEIYEEDSTTQITTAETLTTSFDGVTGLHQIAIDLSDAGFEAGKTYTVVISAGTVDGLSVAGRMIGVFSVNRFATAVEFETEITDRLPSAAAVTNLNTVFNADFATAYNSTSNMWVTEVAPGTEIEVADADIRAALGMSAADLDTQLDAIVADTNELQTDWVNGGRLDLILDARSSQSSVDTIDGIVDAILIDTAEIGVAGAGLSAIPWRAAWDAEVQSEVADALAVYDPPTKAEMDSGFAAISVTLSPEDIAAIAAAVDIDEASLTSAVWAYPSRILTAGTNISLAKGTGVTGFNDLDAAGIRTAVGLASANIDTQFDNIAVTLTAQDIEDIIDGINEGIAPPRINMRPDPGFTFQVSRRADGTYKCTRPLRIAPGAVETIHPAIDMSPLFGQFNYVQTVGTPSISGGSLTVAAEGARDTYAILEVDGTATASEERTITVVVTMTSGASVQVKLDVEVFDE